MACQSEMYYFESSVEVVTPRSRRRQAKSLPSFTYNAGEVNRDHHTPTTSLCCKRARTFRVYHRDDLELIPRGICCVDCDAEYLDMKEYPEGVYDKDQQIQVNCVDMTTDFESSTDDAPSVYNVKMKTVVLHRKVSPPVQLPPLVSFLTMVNPNRKTIHHRNPRDIEGLRPGTHVMWHRPYTLWHHQLIKENKGGGKCDVIHFDTGRTGFRAKAQVQLTMDYDFTAQDNGTAYEILYEESVENSNPLKLVMDRAHSQITELHYSMFTNNCEHLVTFCKTGSRRSLQIHWLRLRVAFLILRVLIVSAAIYVVTKINYLNESISQREENAELLVVFDIEFLVFLAIAFYWSRLHIGRLVGFTDRWRRIGEALLEMVLTVLAYFCHCLTMRTLPKQEFFWHITTGIMFGVFGKLAGCVIGQALAQCILTPVSEFGMPTPQYGRMEYAALAQV